MSTVPNALNATPNDDEPKVNLFGRVVQKIRQALRPETEETPLQFSFGTDAEARGFGKSAFTPDPKSISAWAYDKMRIESGRQAAYRDYELMDGEVPEVGSALDIIAEFATQSDDPKAETFNILSDDDAFSKYLKEKAEQLKLPHLVTATAREIAKYGCAFWEVVCAEDGEMVRVKSLIPHTMVRQEDRFGVLETAEPFYQVHAEDGKKVAVFAAWQVVHGRYQKTLNRLYGNSLLENARRVFKQLQLVEDGMVVARLYRSHMRYVFSMPVDGMTPVQADNYLATKKNEFRKRQRFNPATGKTESFESPISVSEDFFIGVRKEGVPAKVETIQGQGGLHEIGDVQYFQNKLFACLKVPKALLGFEKDVSTRATLTEQDVNFARTLRRIQQVVGYMVVETLTRAMILDGYDPENVATWNVVMPSISTVDNLRQWQIEALKANVALIYGQKLPVVDKEFIWKNVMELSQEDVERLGNLDDDEFGVEAMPNPSAPPAFGAGNRWPSTAASSGVNTPNAVPAGAANPRTEHRLDISKTNSAVAMVKQVRRSLKLNEDDPISSEELDLMHKIREAHELFGDMSIDQDRFAAKFAKARNGNH